VKTSDNNKYFNHSTAKFCQLMMSFGKAKINSHPFEKWILCRSLHTQTLQCTWRRSWDDKESTKTKTVWYKVVASSTKERFLLKGTNREIFYSTLKSWPLKIKVLRSFVTFRTAHQMTRHHIPEYLSVLQHCCENKKPFITKKKPSLFPETY